MDHLEIEIKFFIPDLAPIRHRLRHLGAVCTGQRGFEHNVRYEADDNRLLKKRCLLRLRKDRTTTLTFKSPPRKIDTRFKTYRELEVGVEDFDTMDAILTALGFMHRQVYEKWRETWQLGATMICLDDLPFGSFLEIEGPAEAIMQRVGDLRLDWDRRILSSYLGLFEALRQKESFPFTDVTFDNFNSVGIRFESWRRLFETAKGE